MEQKQYINGEQDRRLNILENTLTNHMSDINARIARIETDTSWLKKNYWMVASAAIGGLIVGIINLLF